MASQKPNNEPKPELPAEFALMIEKLKVVGDKSEAFKNLTALLSRVRGPEDFLLVIQVMLGSGNKARALADALLDYADTVDEAFLPPESKGH